MALVALGDRKSKGANDTAGDFVLDREDILDLAIEPFRPKMITVPCIDQLDSNAEAVSGFADAAFEERLDT